MTRRWRHGLAAIAIAIVAIAAADTLLSSRQVAVNAGVVIPKGNLTQAIRAIENFRTTAPSGWVTAAGAVDEVRTVLAAAISNQASVLLGDPMTGVRFSVTGNYVMASGSTVEVQRARITQSLINSGSMTADVMRVQWLSGSFGLVTSNLVLEAAGTMGTLHADNITVNSGMAAFDSRGTNLTADTVITPRIAGIASQDQVRVVQVSTGTKVYSAIVTNIYDRYAVTNDLFTNVEGTNYAVTSWNVETNATSVVTTNLVTDAVMSSRSASSWVYTTNTFIRQGTNWAVVATTATNTYYPSNTVVYPGAGLYTNIFISTNVVNVDGSREYVNFTNWAFTYTSTVYTNGDYVNIIYTNTYLMVTETNTVTLPASVLGATGGTVTTSTVSGVSYISHKFTAASDTFTATRALSVDFLLVAGGGGGGSGTKAYISSFPYIYYGSGGGGGAGGLIAITNYSVTTGAYPVVIGGGGAGGWTYHILAASDGINGGTSTVFGCTAIGGGGGGGGSLHVGIAGGSGGGGGTGFGKVGGNGTQTNQTGSSGVYGKGHNGGSARTSGAAGYYAGGGGGGAMSNGVDGTGDASHSYGGAGGAGYSWYGDTYAGGGGGGASVSQVAGLGGVGGGGNGSVDQAVPGDGVANTGGGGGGANEYFSGGAGGSGVMIVRYRADSSAGTVIAGPFTNTCVITNAMVYNSPGPSTNTWVFTNAWVYQNYSITSTPWSTTNQVVCSNASWVYANYIGSTTNIYTNVTTTITATPVLSTNAVTNAVTTSRYLGKVSTNYVDKTFGAVYTNISGRVYIDEPASVVPPLGYTNGVWAYLVSTPEHLIWIRSQIGGTAASNIWQTADIDLIDTYLWNVGTNNFIEGFRGIAGNSRQMIQTNDVSQQRWRYYGGGRKIFNAWGQRPAVRVTGVGDSREYAVGLFADGLAYTTIQDLMFSGYLCVNGTVTTAGTTPGSKYVGGLVGSGTTYGSPGSTQCYERLVVNVDSDINVTNGRVSYGGIVGHHEAASLTVPYPLTAAVLSDVLVGGSTRAAVVYATANAAPIVNALCGDVATGLGITNVVSRVAGLGYAESSAVTPSLQTTASSASTYYKYLNPTSFVGKTFGDTNMVTSDPAARFDYNYFPANPLAASRPVDEQCPYQGFTNWTQLGKLYDWYPFPILNFRTNGLASSQGTVSPAFQWYSTVETNTTSYTEVTVSLGDSLYELIQTNEIAITRHDYQHLELTNAYAVGAEMLSSNSVRLAIQNQLYLRHDDVETTEYIWQVTTTTNRVVTLSYPSVLTINNPWVIMGDVSIIGNVYSVAGASGARQELGLLRLPGALTTTNLGFGFASQVSPAYTSVFINVSSSGVVIASMVTSIEFDWRPDNEDSTLTVWSSSNGVDYIQSSTNVFLVMTNRYFRFDATNSAGFVIVSTAAVELQDHHEIARGAAVFGDLTNGMVAILFASGGLYEITRPAEQFAIYSSTATSAVARADGMATILGTFTSAVTRITVDLYNPDGVDLTDNMFMHSLQLLNSTTDLLYTGTLHLDSRDTPEIGRYHVDVKLPGYELGLRAFADYGVEAKVLIGGSE